MAEAAITCVTCGTHQTPVVLTGMSGVAVEVCQKEHERAMHEGERVSAWKMESG